MKKHILSKALSLLLSFSMILGIVPASTAFAAESEKKDSDNKIDKIEITGFTAPVYGETPDFDLIIPEDAHYHFATKEELKSFDYSDDSVAKIINGMSWVDTGDLEIKLGTQDKFGYSFYCADIFVVPDEGYEFNYENLKITINGETSIIKDFFTYPETPEIYIATNLFEISNSESHEHTFGEWKNDETSHWRECSCGAIVDKAEHTFEWVTDKEATTEQAGKKHEQCTVCGYAKEPVEIPVLEKVINKVELTGFTEPVFGATPDFDLIIPEDAHYHFASRTEVVEHGFAESSAETNINGMWWIHSEVPKDLSREDKFEGGNYVSQIIVIPDDGYKFADKNDMTVTINGGKNLIKFFSAYTNEIYIETNFFTIVNPDTPEIENVEITYDLNGGIKGEDFVEKIEVDKGYEITVPGAMSETFAKAPENKEYKGYEVNGKVYTPGEKFKVAEDLTIKLLWEEKEEEKPTPTPTPTPDVPVTPPTPTPTPTPTPDVPVTPPTPTPTPDVPVTPSTPTPTPNVPATPSTPTTPHTPDTGDSTNTGLWLAVNAFAVIGAAVLYLNKKKENNN